MNCPKVVKEFIGLTPDPYMLFGLWRKFKSQKDFQSYIFSSIAQALRLVSLSINHNLGIFFAIIMSQSSKLIYFTP